MKGKETAMTKFTIGKVAEAAGVGVETIRFYERRKLISQPTPIKTSFREYPQSAVNRIRFIKRAQELGFTLSEVAELLALSEQSMASRKSVKELAAKKLLLIREKLDDLRHMETTLSKLVDDCSGKGPLHGCPIIEAITDTQINCH